MIKVGLVGYQTLGKALGKFAVKDKIKVIPHDLKIEEYATPQNMLSALNADFVFVSLPTFIENNKVNVDFIVDAAKRWNDVCANTQSILVINSIVPPGCIEELRCLFDTDNIVYNPLFLESGKEESDFLSSKEMYVGGIDRPANKLCDFYEKWNELHPLRKSKKLEIDIGEDVTIEMIALVKNKLNFQNKELLKTTKMLCEAMEIDYQNVYELLKLKTFSNDLAKICFDNLSKEVYYE